MEQGACLVVSQRLSAVSVDRSEGDELDCSGMDGAPDQMELSASWDRNNTRPTALLPADLPLDPVPTLMLNLVPGVFPLVLAPPPFLAFALVILASSLILCLLLDLISDDILRLKLWATQNPQGLVSSQAS